MFLQEACQYVGTYFKVYKKESEAELMKPIFLFCGFLVLQICYC